MGESGDKSPELEELLLRVLSKEASEEELSWLNQSLLESADLRDEALRFLCDESLLREVSVTERDAADLRKFLLVSGEPADELIVSSESPVLSRVFDAINHHGFTIAATALLVITGLGFYAATLRAKLARLHSLTIAGVSDSTDSGRGGAASDGESEAEGDVLGRVCGLDSPVWSEGASPVGFGDRLHTGQTIGLESGVVELLLSTGAKVTIEGPAEFQAGSALESTLLHGKIAAAAPRVARGYTVITPTAEVVDIGTQFGVLVESSGESELHVFDGDVVARSRLAAEGAQLLHAKQDEAMRFSKLDAQPTRFTAREQDFIRHASPRYESSDLPPLPSTDSLSVWYTADRCAESTTNDRVGAWRDLLVDGNLFADNAWQFDELRRPLLVSDGAGRRALRFDGWSSYLATSPVEASQQQTIFLVYLKGPVALTEEQFLISYQESPSLEIMLHGDSRVEARVCPGPGADCVGTLLSEPVDNAQPAVIAYQYDAENNQSKLWINDKLQATAEAPLAMPKSGQRFIGCHPDLSKHTGYLGNLYEVVMYDRAFDDQKMSEFWGYFSKRYGLEQAGEDP